MIPMKHLLSAFPLLAALCSLSAQDATPTPAPPVSAPKPGMAWEIDIRPALVPLPPPAAAQSQPTPTPAPPLRLTGCRGKSASAWTVQYPGGATRDFLLAGSRLFAWNEKTGKLSMPALRDGQHDEALAFEVSGFPGINWVTPDKTPTLVKDPQTRTWRATYTQEASPFKIVNAGTEGEYAIPTGPSVRVVAVFDPATGLPLTAIVGDRTFTYRINPNHGSEPSLSPAFRQALDARLKREAALQSAIDREEKKSRR